MIIVPTEKKFDWHHAPIVLFVVVLLNVLIFFLYQSGDNKRFADAVAAYNEADYFEKEWPLFQNYLLSHKESELLREYRELAAEENYEPIIVNLLSRQDFFPYMQKNARAEFGRFFYDEWELERSRINAKVQSLSYYAYGLRANQIRIPAFITHQFLHGDTMHLLGNMFFLIICGFAVEAAIGHWRFLLFYLISGVAAGLSQVAFNWESSSPLVGASGAISGVMAMYLAIFRLKKIEFFYWFFFFVGYLRAPALLILPFYLGKEVYSYLNDTESNVAFMAHAGGFIAGAVLIGVAILLNRSMLNTTYIETDNTIDPQQQKLAEIYDAIGKFRFERALASVNELIKTQGLSFELAVIRYNLLKINRGDEYLAAIVSLLSMPNLMPNEVKKLDKVWRDNPEAHSQLSDLSAIKLGMQFASLDNPQSAEEIFTLLTRRAYTSPVMAVFASKLAKAFQTLREHEKKAHYDMLTQQLSKQHLQGV